ncbi:MAG: metallophosphoesterase family protein [Armatimonadetes bacterium]|nr:metallophosphoesterase family protein [Armatimonadota bacterium]
MVFTSVKDKVVGTLTNAGAAEVWFTSDTHFGHKLGRLLEYRGFTDVDEMNEVLVQRWNARVKPEDVVYHLGDLALGSPATKEYVQRLNGRILWVGGNHDHRRTFKLYADVVHTILPPLHEIQVEEHHVVLCHYPMRHWNRSHYGSYHLHGHNHGNLVHVAERAMDVGVDPCGLAPVSFEEVEAYMNAQQVTFDDSGRICQSV